MRKIVTGGPNLDHPFLLVDKWLFEYDKQLSVVLSF